MREETEINGIKMRERLVVVIPTFNRAKSLRRCLESLGKQTDKDFRVLIIDGGSKDETEKVIAEFKRELKIEVIVEKKPHLAYIRDLGWREAQGEIVAFVDDDVVVSKNWVKAIKEAFKKNGKLGGVTGPTVIPKRLLQNRDVFLFHTTKNPVIKFLGKIYFALFMGGEKYGIGKIYPSGAWSPGSNFPQARKLKKPIEVDYLEACNFAIPKKILEEVGGFDLNYKGTSEWSEVDLAFRVRKGGYRLIFDLKVAVEHWVSKKGVFARRLQVFARMHNLLRFYLDSYYPKKFLGSILFIFYLLFLSIYWVFLLTGKLIFKIKNNNRGVILSIRN